MEVAGRCVYHIQHCWQYEDGVVGRQWGSECPINENGDMSIERQNLQKIIIVTSEVWKNPRVLGSLPCTMCSAMCHASCAEIY